NSYIPANHTCLKARTIPCLAKTFFEALHKNENDGQDHTFLRRVAQQTRQKPRRGALNRN
ncbi:hypothetical protein, partial [Pseudomonas aeruginosa]|uniref:hypothetical protein n=1 Tax=Pseudomonas aeruginosa TaxID=287 RepID=UPI0026F12B08